MPPRLQIRPLLALRQTTALFAPSTGNATLARLYSAKSAAPTSSLLQITDLPSPSSGVIRILELNRPDARNAISKALLAALRTEIDAIARQYGPGGEEISSAIDPARGPVRALVVASAVESCFCAGADLKERRGFSQDETAQFLENLRDTFKSLAALPVPTISAISSLALGGGLELALATHFRVLTSNAVVGLPETRLGILPGAGGTYRLPAVVGLNRARDLVLTGRRVAAPEAYFLGLADRLVEVLPEEDDGKNGGSDAKGKILETARRSALSEAVRMAQEICEGGPVAIRAALEAVSWAREEKENEMYLRVVNTEDRDEALKAFQEKRKPVFKGR